MQFIQLYAVASIVGTLAQTLTDQRSPVLGASAAVNALVILSVCLNPFATYLVMGVVPAPAWAVGGGFLLYDLYGAAAVCACWAYASLGMLQSQCPLQTFALTF